MNRTKLFQKLFLTAALLASASALAMSSRKAEDILVVITNAAPAPAVITNAAPAPVIIESAPVSIQSVVAAGSFVRPAIACGPQGKLAVSAEGPGMGSLHLWVWDGNNWSGGQVVTASASTAKRTYVSDVVMDADG